MMSENGNDLPDPKPMGQTASQHIHRPEDYLPREIEIVERAPGWLSICVGFLFVLVLVIGTALASKAYMELKYELKYNCLPRGDTRELLWPIPQPTNTPVLPTIKP